jgi:Ca2+-binding RTX toxin-like protein
VQLRGIAAQQELSMGDTMNKGRNYVASALALSLALTGCAAEEAGNNAHEGEIDDWGDDQKYPELGGAYSALTALAGTCAYDTTTNVVTVNSTGAQTILIGKRAVDSALLVNGVACSTATTKTMKKLVVTTTGSVAEVLVIDFLGGLFAPATAVAGAAGIDINLGGGTDAVRIRGTSGKDAMYMGSDNSIGFNTDAFKDITMAGVESVAVALASGDDIFSATNAASPTVTKGVSGSSSLPLTLSGGAGNDDITGGAGIDTLNGGLGNDSLSGGLAADILNGEAGDDTIKALDVIDATDDVNCGADTDTVSYAERTNAITATIAGTGGEGVEADTIENTCENLTGGDGNDVLTGLAAQVNVLSGGDGDDTLKGMSGNDVLNGGNGNDTFDESDTTDGGGSDTFNGGAGTDTVDYSGRTATLNVSMDGKAADDGENSEADDVEADVENVTGGTLANIIVGNALNNVITGGAAADTLSGGDGNDTLVGLALADTLNGGAGDDTFSEGSATNGGDTFNGGDGTDTVDYGSRTGDLTVTMAGATANDGLALEADNIQEDVENCNGGSGLDSITGNALDNVINGGGGLDVLLSGLAGDDFIDGEGALATSIVCGDGDDIALNGTVDGTCEL